MKLDVYQKLCKQSKIIWTQHCLQRMQEVAVIDYQHAA